MRQKVIPYRQIWLDRQLVSTSLGVSVFYLEKDASWLAYVDRIHLDYKLQGHWTSREVTVKET